MHCISFENMTVTIDKFVQEINSSDLRMLLPAAAIFAIVSLITFFAHNGDYNMK